MTPPKVRKCSVPGCLSREDQPPCPIFYVVPYRNKSRRIMWLKLLNIQNARDIKKTMYVCQKHFVKQFIDIDKKIRRHAYPTLFTQEEIEAGKSERYPVKNVLRCTAADLIFWVGHNGFKAMPDHTYGFTPIIDYTSSIGFTLIPDHTYSIPPVQQINDNINFFTADNDKEDTINNNSAQKEDKQQNSEDKQKEENNDNDKETGENSLADKEKREDNTENKEKIENTEDKQKRENDTENKEILETTEAKEREENNSADKENGETNSEEKKKEDEPKKPKKRKRHPLLGSAKRPIYFIHDNKENKTSNNNPNIPNIVIFNNNNRDDNSTDNDNNPTPNFVVLNNGNNAVENPKNISNLLPDIISLANNNSNDSASSKLYKLLIDNNIISNNANNNYVTDDGAIDNEDDDNDFDSNMVIDLAENPPNTVDNNVSADDNPLDDNDKPGHDLVVDHTEVISDIVQNNINNEQILERIVTEINRIESSLSDTIKTTNIVGGNKELTEKLDMNEMALINYNNTVVLCHKNDVAELKNNYPELLDQNNQIDQDLVTKVKRHRLLRYRRKTRFKKQVGNTDKNTENEDQEAVRNIPCACDANSPCEHRKRSSKIPLSRVLIFCDDCKEEHFVNYKFCKRNAPKPSPMQEIVKKNKDRKKYITAEKFEQMSGNLQKLLQTSQQLQGQINSLTTVLTSLATAVSRIEKEREEMNKRKPRKPRIRRKKKVEKTLPEAETLPEQESLFVNKHKLEERVNLREKRHIHIEVYSQERETSPEQESLPVQETFPINRILHGSKPDTVIRPSRRVLRLPEREPLRLFEYSPENIPSRRKQHLPEPEILTVNGNLPETILLRGSNQETLRVNRPLLVNKHLPQREILPVHGTLSTDNFFPGNRGLLEKQYLLANRSLPLL